MRVTTVDTLQEFKARLGLERDGVVLEPDLDVVQNDCDLNGRKRRDAEVLCTVAANVGGVCLDLGTSLGRSAYRLATNLGDRGVVYTVNILPEQYDSASGQLITHLLSKEDIGSFYRSRGLTNVTQVYADTATWEVPPEIDDVSIVYVDAAHDTDRVHGDTKKIYERIAPGGFVCWHDFSPDRRAAFDWIDSAMTGVERFVDETCPGAEIVHLRDSWVGVLRKPAAAAASDTLRVGFVVDPSFSAENRWTSLTTPHLVRAIAETFDIRWIHDQAGYEAHLGEVDVLLSLEAGWDAPTLDLFRTPALTRRLRSVPSYMFYSDPHAKKWREEYVLHGFDYLLAYYDNPTRHHFRRLPADRLVHFPWAIPDAWIGRSDLVCRGWPRLTVFGASDHEAYDLRNWCRTFPFVESCTNSGCQNKSLTESGYLDWLADRDAIVAAGSDDPKYRLTTPKYFEIAASGALLFAQDTDDLRALGFRHMENCVVFTRSNFESLACEYLRAPGEYLDIRRKGRELVRERHALSVRLRFLDEHMRGRLDRQRAA